MFIDSHCHLNYKGLVEEQRAVLARARGAGRCRDAQYLDPRERVG